MFLTLIAIALLALAGAIALPFSFDVSPAARVHLAFAVGIMPLILAAFDYFVPVLTRSGASSRAVRTLPWIALASGVVAFAHFAARGELPYALPAAALVALLAAAGSANWMLGRGSKAVGRPHPCLYWYVAAAACLSLSAAAALAMSIRPDLYLVLKRVHLHLNTVGFIGLTAVATLQVLMPTVAGRPDARVTERLRRDLPFAVAGSALIAVGAAWQASLAWAGFILWLVPLARLGAAWWRLYRIEIFAWRGAAPPLAAALAGFTFMLVVAPLQALAHRTTGNAAFAFILIFLLPLVTGAATALLPVLLRPGAQTPWHAAFRDMAGRFAGLRALLFLLGGAALALGLQEGVLLTAIALALFAVQLARAMRAG